MMMEEWLEEERAEARAEGRTAAILDMLKDLGDVPEEITKRIMSERNLEVLKKWNRYAARADSLEEFLKNFEN